MNDEERERLYRDAIRKTGGDRWHPHLMTPAEREAYRRERDAWRWRHRGLLESFARALGRVKGRPPGRVITDEDLRRAAARLIVDEDVRPTDERAARILSVSEDTIRRQRARRPWREFLPVSAVE